MILANLITTLNTTKAYENNQLTAGFTKFLFEIPMEESEAFVEENEKIEVSQSSFELDNRIPVCFKKYSCETFKRLGRVWYGDFTYTWYSQKVLPGGGLKIPGRHVNEDGLVCDEEGYVVIASDDLSKGTVVDTPIGIQGKVYDCGSGCGNLDIYVDW